MEYSLSDYGSWASIVGLILTAITFFMIIGIKKRFLFRSNVNEHRISLSEKISEISQLLIDYSKNIQEIDGILAIVEVKLRNMEKGANGHLLSDIKSARKKIRTYSTRNRFFNKANNKTESSVRGINTALNVVVEELENVKKELMVGN